MKRKQYTALITAAIMSVMCGGAYAAADGAAVKNADFGYEILQGTDQQFDGNTADGWKTVNESDGITVSDGAMCVTAEDGGVKTDIGNKLYESAAAKGTSFWDFEDDTNDGVSTDYILEYGKWTGQYLSEKNTHRPYMQPVYVAMEDVYYVNPTKETPKKNENPPPVKGSTKCMGLWCPPKTLSSASVPQTMAVRTKISKDMMGENRTFTLSFYSMVNTSENASYACFRKPGDPEFLPNWVSSDGKTSAIPFISDDASASVGTIKLGWQRYETTVTADESAFDENGDTALWIITRARSVKSNEGKYWQLTPGQWLYFDDISLNPVQDTEISEYVFNCRVKGVAGQSVTAAVKTDSGRTLFTENGIIGKDNEWQNISGAFSMSSDDEFITGEDRCSAKLKDNGKAQLIITSSGTDAVFVDDVSLIKKSDGDLSKLSSQNVSLYADAFVSAPTDAASLVCSLYNNGSEQKLVQVSSQVSDGKSGLLACMKMPKLSADAELRFYIADTAGKRLTERLYGQEFFANGVNLIYSPDTKLKQVFESFGAGQYLVEFKAEGISQNTDISISAGGAKTTFNADKDGIFGAEIDVTDEVIKALGDEAVIEISGGSVSEITVKKLLDY